MAKKRAKRKRPKPPDWICSDCGAVEKLSWNEAYSQKSQRCCRCGGPLHRVSHERRMERNSL